MTKYCANKFYSLRDGLTITGRDGKVTLNIKAESTNEIESIARLILPALNSEYDYKMAAMRDNDDNYKMGLINEAQRKEREDQIITTILPS